MSPTPLAVLRRLITVSLVLLALAALYGISGAPRGRLLGQVLVTLAVAALGSTLLWVDLACPTGPRSRRLGLAGGAAALGGAVLSLVLAWTPLVTSGLLWRCWWLLACVAVNAAHVLLLLRAPAAPPALRHLRSATLASTLAFAAVVVGMTFRADVFALPGRLLTPLLAATGAVGALGSLVLLAAAQPGTVRLPWTAVRAARWVALPVLLFTGGFYLGRVSAPLPGVLEGGPGPLAGLADEAVDDQVRADLGRLKAIARALEDGRARAEALRAALAAKLGAEGGAVFTPEEDDAIRSLFLSYLSCRTALLRTCAFFRDFESVRDAARKARCFLIGFAAGVLCYDASLSLVSAYAGLPMARAKLNEPEPKWGIPAGMFDRIHESVAMEKHSRLFSEMTAYFQHHRERWRASGLPPEDVAWLESAIEHSAAAVTTNPLFGRPAPLYLLLDKVKQDAYSPVYAVQSILSTWIGDTRLVRREPCISKEQVEEMRARLRPGDIILERRNWFLSNAFLPGFWPHAALYVGTSADLERLGIAGDPAVRARAAEFARRAHDGEERCVVESISEGVSFSSLSEATRADYIAVLRPRCGEQQIAGAIARAFSHQGKPYDFEFDFFSSDKLVCTELVYRSYEGALHFELVKIMGRMTLPAVEIARKFVREEGAPGQELEFVLFLDTAPGADRAALAGPEAFRGSAERPRAFNE